MGEVLAKGDEGWGKNDGSTKQKAIRARPRPKLINNAANLHVLGRRTCSLCMWICTCVSVCVCESVCKCHTSPCCRCVWYKKLSLCCI